ncbi:YbaN family protein [uncultured Kiloniella sp.]|uniref:YbaN family protein n=1 Tax=uncultured Kiloniella sp. TaxID=1133091 RepID=UPI0026208E19|nr:YbaN family protein [uncultured Kiloniella sp.]
MSKPDFAESTKLKKTGIRRICLIGLGWICVVLGLIGIVLPLLPTTPFLLVALWAFSHSSERFHNWLYQHHLFGPMVRDWDCYRVIPLKAKALAITMMSASLGYVAYKEVVPLWGLGLVGLCLLCVAVFILRCPSQPPAKISDQLPR